MMRVNKNSVYYRNLIQRVIDNSEASTWENAVLEWEIFDCEEDETLESSCICGKEELRYLFTIRNTTNGNVIYLNRPDFTGGSKFEKMEPLWKSKKESVTPKKSETKRFGWSMSTKASTLRSGLASSRLPRSSV